MESLYRSILKTTWVITKKYKFLWIFGIFALWLGNNGEIQMFFRTLYFIEDSTSSNIQQAIANNFIFLNFFHGASFLGILQGLIFILIFIIFLLFGIWLVIVSQIALIRAADNLSDKKKINFSSLIKTAMIDFWPVFGLNFISKILIAILIFILLLPLLIIVIKTSVTVALLLSILIWVIFLPLATIISFVMKYAINFLVIKNEKFWDAISKAWVLFKVNWLISIEMALILVGINLSIALFISKILPLLFIPKILLLFVIYLFLNSLLAVFQTVSWTLLFKSLISGRRYSKLIRIIVSLSNYMNLDNQVTKISDVNISKTPILKRRPGRPKTRKLKK